MVMKFVKFISLSFVTLLLIGCFSVKRDTTATYVLNTPAPNVIHAPRAPITLLVSLPKASAGYNSQRIAYMMKPYQLNYFTKSFWAESPSRMLQPLIVESLQQTGHYRAVVSVPFSGVYDLRLDTELVQLQQEFFKNPSCVRLVLRAQLLDANTQKIIANREFVAEEISPQENPYGGVIAANRATEKLLQELVKFCVQVIDVNKNGL